MTAKDLQRQHETITQELQGWRTRRDHASRGRSYPVEFTW
jgi:hypothetical protein